jgi:hypothetical protein
VLPVFSAGLRYFDENSRSRFRAQKIRPRNWKTPGICECTRAFACKQQKLFAPALRRRGYEP